MLLLVLGCTWVREARYQARLLELDDDRDGFTLDGGDCNDADPTINPDASETWYDGVDQNCDGLNDWDKDGDTFSDASAPDVVAGEIDCDDEDPEIFPGALEIWYDGIDQNCLGDSDYDQDSDGFEARPPSGPGQDCFDGPTSRPDDATAYQKILDRAASIFPGAADTWYDGVDQDCGEDDDYDQDGDGYLPPQGLDGGGNPKPTEFCTTCTGLPDGDCDDTRDGVTDTFTGAEVNPAAQEHWYDGIDQNCDGRNDWDQDGDGFGVVAGFTGDVPEPTIFCDDCVDPLWFDCDDDPSNDGTKAVPAAEIYLGATEDIANTAQDIDCDGDKKGFSVDPMGWTLTGAHDLRAAASSSEVFFSIAGSNINPGDGSGVRLNTALAWAYDINDLSSSTGVVDWANQSSDIPTGGQAFLIDGTDIYGALGLLTGDGRQTVVTRYRGTGTPAEITGLQFIFTDTTDIAMRRDAAGVLHAIACDEDPGFHYTRVENFAGDPEANVLYSGYSALACDVWVSGTTGILGYSDAYDSNRYVKLSWSLSSTTPSFSEILRDSTVQPSGALDYLAGADGNLVEVLTDTEADEIVVRHNGGERIIAPPGKPISAEAVLDPVSGDLIITWADVDGNAGIAWGTVSGGFSIGTISLPVGALEVVPWSSGTEVVVVVLTESDLYANTILAP